MRFFLVLFFGLCLANEKGFAQRLQVSINEDNHFGIHQKPYDTIKLTWKDFSAQGLPPNGWTAITHTNTHFSCSVQKTKEVVKVKYQLNFYFDRNKSSKNDNSISDYILGHEQLHFDIAWYCYQQFLAEIKSTIFTIDNYNQIFKQKFQLYLDSNTAMQNLYDEQTDHSRDVLRQEEWNKKVAELLQQITK
jgi:hypothetical protein